MVSAMIGRRLFAGMLMLLALAPAASAQQSQQSVTRRATAVVELFTSQSCTQCPRGNRLLGTLAQNEGLLALTFPVGIWDYLGWQDTLARPEFTDRQRDFARALHLRGRFTPQLVINGAVSSTASDWDEALATLDDTRRTPLAAPPELTLTRVRSGRVRVAVGGAPRREAANVWLVSYDPGPVIVFITGGLNLNRRIYHYNVVRDLDLLGQWAGGPIYFEHDRCQPECAVILQEPDGGRILAATYTAPRRPVAVPRRERQPPA
jgi:hypothetical protein